MNSEAGPLRAQCSRPWILKPGLGTFSCVTRQCQLLSISLVLFHVSLGRQADRTVTCECSHNGLSCLPDKCALGKPQRDYQHSQQLKVVFKNRMDCFKLFSLNLILIFSWQSTVPTDMNVFNSNDPCGAVSENMEPSSVPSFLDFIFSGLGILQKVSQEKSLDARQQAEALRPAGPWCSFIPPRNGHKVKVNSDHLANACLSAEVIQTSPCWLTAKRHLFYLLFAQITHLWKIRP